MTNARRLLRWARSRGWFAAWVVTFAVLAYPWVNRLVVGVEVTSAERGYHVAQRAGCFDCHGPNGTGGVKNPGSQDDEVPGFSGGTAMMWAKSEAEMREYILDGAPTRKRNDAAFKQKRDAQLLAMPAYRGHLNDREVDDLMVYLRAVSGLVTPPDELAAQGQEVAYRFGCFHCHGPMGAGGNQNPGALKGYIPGWWGSDFRDLVRNDDELRNWVRDGEVPRLRENAFARYFLERQRVYMPAYRNFMNDTQLHALVRYIRWINDGQWQNKPLDLEH